MRRHPRGVRVSGEGFKGEKRLYTHGLRFEVAKGESGNPDQPPPIERAP